MLEENLFVTAGRIGELLLKAGAFAIYNHSTTLVYYKFFVIKTVLTN